MKRKITPQPATKTPRDFKKQLVQLDACNIDVERAADKPHSHLFFRGGDVLAEIEGALGALNPPTKLLDAGIGFYVRLPIDVTASVLESIGFRKEIVESNIYFRPTR